jgi:nucleotide-binding universal stress UspA family protein
MFERIVAAIDSDPERSSKVVEAAKELASAHGSQVLVVHVRQVEVPPGMAVPTARASALQPALHFETEEEARELVEGAVEQVRGVAVTVRGEVVSGAGSTARELLEIARSFEATLIIVGDRSSRVTDLLLGDVAHRIVHLAPCPVLLVR